MVEGYKSSAKASRKRPATQRWMSDLSANARKEQIKLKNGTWKSRGFNNFTIKERGKWRNIQSVHISEKGIQNSLCNNCLIPLIRPHLIYDNGASLKGKGTAFALNEFEKHLREHYRKYGRAGGIYFYDFSGYFSNINHAPLTDMVWKAVLNSAIMKIYKMFIDAFGGIGLGLGSQVSQISAVFYPNSLDHMIKDGFGIRGNARYMDDGYIIHHDLTVLKKISLVFEEKCAEMGIVMNKKKCHIVRFCRSFIFLKTRFFVTGSGKVVRRPPRAAARKERDRLRAFRRFYDMGVMTFEEIYLNFHSWLLSLNNGRTFNVKLNAIVFFDNLFHEFPNYKPLKTKTRRQKVLSYISRRAEWETEKEPKSWKKHTPKQSSLLSGEC